MAIPEIFDDLGEVELLAGDLTEAIGDDDLFSGADELGTVLVEGLDGSSFYDPNPSPDIVPVIDGFFDDVFSAVKSVGKAIVKSPITKVIAGAAAIVMPAIGLPLAAGLTIADRAIATADGLRTAKSPAAAARVKKAVAHTIMIAKQKTPQGKPAHPEAAKMVELFHVAQKLRKAQDKRLATVKRKPPVLKAAGRPGAHAPAKIGTLVTRDPKTHKLIVVKHARGFVPA